MIQSPGLAMTEAEQQSASIGELQAEIARLKRSLASAQSRIAELENRPASPGSADEDVRVLADALPIFVSIIDREGRYRLVNRPYEEWFGRPRASILGRTVREVFGEEAYPARRSQIEAALRGARQRFETVTPRPDGSPRTTEIEYLPRKGSDGEPDGFYVLAIDVTDRRAAERALRENEARLRLAVDAGRMAVWEVDVRSETLAGSRELNRLLGFPDEASPTLREIRAGYAPGEQERLQSAARTALERGDRFVESEFRYIRPDGQHRWLMLRAEIHLDPDGSPSRYVGVLLDITERKQAEGRLRASEETLRAALSAARLGAWERDLVTGEMVATATCKANLGLPPDAPFTFEMLQAMRHPDDAERVTQAIRRAVAEDVDYDVEYRAIWPNGSVHWLLARGHAVYDEAGKPMRMVGVTLDITERKRTEEALRTSETLKSAILESALDAIVTITDESRIIEWNPAAARTFGWSREEALGRDLADLIIPPEYREKHREGMARYLATGDGPVLGRRIELEALRADGSRFPVELAISPTHIEGKPRFTAYLRDITPRRQAEADLRESEQRLRATYEHAFAGIAEVDHDGRFLRANEQFSFITGYSREELLERTFLDLTHPGDWAADLERFRRQMTGGPEAYALEKRYVHKDGHDVWIELSASRVDDEAGRPLYGVRVVRDVTERRRAEEHRNLLINELNHRVKNTLATVQAIVGQTLRLTPPEDVRAAIEARLAALARVHDVLTRESWEGAGLREIMVQAVEPFFATGEHRIRIDGPDLRLQPRMALSLAMAAQELVTNALKYGALSSETGRVSVAWEARERDGGRRLRLRWEESGGPVVRAPSRRGFGSRLIERGLAQELGGEVRLDFAPSGVVCTLDVPLA